MGGATNIHERSLRPDVWMNEGMDGQVIEVEGSAGLFHRNETGWHGFRLYWSQNKGPDRRKCRTDLNEESNEP